MNYLSLNNFNDILYSYITIGGSSFTRGATLGIRIEIVLLVLASINYVYAKRKNLALAVFSGWSIYTVLFISGAIPYILSHINRFFKLTYMHNDQSTLLFLLTLDLLLLMIPLLVLSRKRVKQFIIYSVRPANLFFVIAFIFGAIWARQNYTANWSLNPTTLFYFLLIPFVFLFLLILRYYFFLSENKTIGNPVFYKVILALLLFIGILLSEHVFFMVVIIWSLIHVKYDSPLYLQKFIFPSCMIDGLLLCSAILFGFVLFGAPMVGFPKLYLVITLVFGSSLSWLHRKFIANQLASKL